VVGKVDVYCNPLSFFFICCFLGYDTWLDLFSDNTTSLHPIILLFTSPSLRRGPVRVAVSANSPVQRAPPHQLLHLFDTQHPAHLLILNGPTRRLGNGIDVDGRNGEEVGD